MSDKTGTLTKNDMELKRLHLGTMSYGADTMDEVNSQLVTAYQNQEAEEPGFRMKRTRDISIRIKELVQALAICHNVTPVYEDGILEYQASSPDEMAIVKWTKSVGVSLIRRTLASILLETPAGSEASFSVLHIFPFTSESKRMGIIIRDSATGEITFYQKGAGILECLLLLDTVMAKIVSYNDWLEEECGNMAREGLRTLVVAKKRLTPDMYDDFVSRYESARVAVGDRQAAIQQVVSTCLERDLELLGLTGVEDKLQDDVKTTLELLRNAGLRIWMLTGDKIETAITIAISCKLVNRGQKIHQIAKGIMCFFCLYA